MGVFTEQFTRLCAEVVSLRRGRQAFETALAQESESRKRAIRSLCGDFTRARREMAQQTRQDRLAFLTAIQRAVGAQRQALNTDLTLARRAWVGKGA